MAWGSGSYGALGQGKLPTADFFEAVAVPGLPLDVVGVGCGSFHSLAWTSDGRLFTWGRAVEGQLSRDLAPGEMDASVAPAPAEGLEGRHRVTYATGSGVVTFAITDKGVLLAAGSSKRGQLGLGPERLSAPRFEPVPLPGPALAVSAGWGHTLALVDVGSEPRVFSWGWPAHGRLGHTFASSAAEEEEQALKERCVTTPREVEVLRGVRIAAVATAADTSYCITQDGRLLSFGDNSLGQLGRPERTEGEYTALQDASPWEVHVPRASDPGRDVLFRRMAAGLGHCVAVTGGGNLLAWGWNCAGQLGLGGPGEEADVVTTPRLIFGVAKSRPALVAAGRVHSVLVNDDVAHDRGTIVTAFGRRWPCQTMVHAWGSAANGRLGTGTYEDSAFPELVPALEGELVVGVAAGMDHTLALVGREGTAQGPLTRTQRG
jgi:alpha-tubulin suppressor-like RCC1 family protein